MEKIFNPKIALAVMLLLTARGLLSANSSLDFLDQNIDARIHAHGGAFIADPNGYSSFARNPSVLSLSSGTPVSTSLGLRSEGIRTYQLAASRPVRNVGYGLSIFQVSYPEQTRIDSEGNVAGSFKNSDLAVTFGAGREFGRVGFGVSGTYVRKVLADISGSGLGMSGSLYFPFHKRAGVGFGVTDLSIKDLSLDGRSEKFPGQYRGGIMGRVIDRDSFTLDSMLDLVTADEQKIAANIGMELNLNETFYLRGGMSSLASGGRVGLGLWLSRARLDWSMQLGELSSKDFMTLSMGYKF